MHLAFSVTERRQSENLTVSFVNFILFIWKLALCQQNWQQSHPEQQQGIFPHIKINSNFKKKGREKKKKKKESYAVKWHYYP